MDSGGGIVIAFSCVPNVLWAPTVLNKISGSPDQTKGHKYGHGTCGEDDDDRGRREMKEGSGRE